MASAQCEMNVETFVALNSEEEAGLDEMIKQAECSLEFQQLSAQPLAVAADGKAGGAPGAKLQATLVPGVLKNQTKGPLIVMDSKIYAGHIVRNFTNPLQSAGSFFMSGMTAEGVKAAVLYSGKNKAGVECGWLLAFADTKATGKRMRQVYLQCGRKGKFTNINWEQVKNKLNHGKSWGKVTDAETGTSLVAAIGGSGGKSVVAAGFLG